ncbi:transporter substrate-binding domain-containing protein [Gordonia sp. (in: high G+C Gram-positive bacteria)]|uniref:transporter substrate-binding domain-containing protein n=1 Tax=Gordonia sp. (in: high G+C Gram-positive bacteria) TaxID=84139 RepID=UPI003F9BF847
MSHSRTLPRLLAIGMVLLLTLAGGLTACGSDSGPDAAADAGAVPTQDVVSSVVRDPRVAALLPADVRASGALTVGSVEAVGQSQLPHVGVVDGDQVGLDIDIANAVAKVLGVDWHREYGTFATIVPGVQNGRYQVGQANFGVTKARTEVLDFATYLNDGQGFLGASTVDSDKIATLTDACGYRIATTPGSTFQTLLETHASDCAKQGKKPWTVQYFADQGPIVLGLQNGKVDLMFGPTLSLRYAAQHVPNTKFLGELTATPVGFVTAKGSPIGPALNAAVNKLIDTGDYHRIFEKWGVTQTQVRRSEINPSATF